MAQKLCDLKSCYLCSHCTKDWLPAIAAHKKNVLVKKGQQVFKEGQAVDHMYFIYSGRVKIHRRWDNEKELIIRFADKGDILGHLGLGKTPVYPVTATAIETTIVCSVDVAFFESSLKVNPDLTYSLMKLFANELQQSEKRMNILVHMPVKERIALALLTLAKQFGETEDGFIGIELTKQDISSFAAVSYETFFKVTTEFQKNKLISTTGKQIKILNKAALSKLVSAL